MLVLRILLLRCWTLGSSSFILLWLNSFSRLMNLSRSTITCTKETTIFEWNQHRIAPLLCDQQWCLIYNGLLVIIGHCSQLVLGVQIFFILINNKDYKLFFIKRSSVLCRAFNDEFSTDLTKVSRHNSLSICNVLYIHEHPDLFVLSF